MCEQCHHYELLHVYSIWHDLSHTLAVRRKVIIISNCRLVPYWRKLLGVSWSRTRNFNVSVTLKKMPFSEQMMVMRTTVTDLRSSSTTTIMMSYWIPAQNSLYALSLFAIPLLTISLLAISLPSFTCYFFKCHFLTCEFLTSNFLTCPFLT